MRETAPFCIAGMTFSTPILAGLITPQETVLAMCISPFRLFAALRLGLRGPTRSLPLEHPARIFLRQGADRVERRNLFRRQRGLDRREIVVELLDALSA